MFFANNTPKDPNVRGNKGMQINIAHEDSQADPGKPALLCGERAGHGQLASTVEATQHTPP